MSVLILVPLADFFCFILLFFLQLLLLLLILVIIVSQCEHVFINICIKQWMVRNKFLKALKKKRSSVSKIIK